MVVFVALNYEHLNTTFYVIFFLLAVYLFLFGFAVGQNFSNPIRKLLKSADNLSKGDLKSRSYLETKDEIGELARTFNRIAEDLEESRSETEMLERSVDMKVQARTQSMEETVSALEQKVRNRTLENQKIFSELEQFRRQAKDKEAETSNLKDQIAELREILEKKGKKKTATAKEI